MATAPVPAACESDVDQECRRHLAGTATFEATPRADNVAAGRIVNTMFTGSAPRLTLRLGELVLPLQMVKIESRMVTGAAQDRVLIVGAIAAADLDAVVVPGLSAVAHCPSLPPLLSAAA